MKKFKGHFWLPSDPTRPHSIKYNISRKKLGQNQTTWMTFFFKVRLPTENNFMGEIHSFTNLKIRDPNLRFVYFLEMYFRFEVRDSVIDEQRFESRFEIWSPSMEMRFRYKSRCRNYFCQDSDSANLKLTNLKIRKNVFLIN